jgi:hypothetical protein
LLLLLKKKLYLSSKSLNYVKKFQITCKKVISETWKRENDRSISRSVNCTKGLWQTIKKVIRELLKNK